jgi:hypothetical protein
MGKKVALDETAYMPNVPEWWTDEQRGLVEKSYKDGFDVAKKKYTKDSMEAFFGGSYEADNYRGFLRVSVWVFSIITALALLIILVMASVYGIRKSYNYFFPPDPNAVVAIQAPESLAEAIYKIDRAKQNPDGIFRSNPWPEWGFLDEQTRNIYRKKAIARTEGRPEGEPGQEPPQAKESTP